MYATTMVQKSKRINHLVTAILRKCNLVYGAISMTLDYTFNVQHFAHCYYLQALTALFKVKPHRIWSEMRNWHSTIL